MHPTHNEVIDTVTTPARTLRDAARYLARHGWIQGAYYDPSATVFSPAACAVGAVGMVCYGGPVDAPALNEFDPGFGDFTAAVDRVENYLTRVTGDADASVYAFNDAPGRTCDEVTALLNAAADEWDRSDRPGLPCCGSLMVEHQPSVSIFPGEQAEVTRVFRCPSCRTWRHVEVTDPGEKDRLFAVVNEVYPAPVREATPTDDGPKHVGHPHQPGARHDCPACEYDCFCADGFVCVSCAVMQENLPTNTYGGVA